MYTRRSKFWRTSLIILGAASFAGAQALTPAEIKNPQMRALQEKYLQQLQAVGSEIQAHIFPYPFYFSRVLDLELAQQEHADQRSLRFDNYGGMTVVELTGNYFASYSSELVNKSHRALRTFHDVMLPAIEIAVNELKDNPDVEGFAMEISHRIRGKAMGMNVEKPENLVIVLSKQAALKLVDAKNENDRQAAILEGQFFVNGEPFVLYLSDQAEANAAKHVDQGDANSEAKNDRSVKMARTVPASSAVRTAPPAAISAPPPTPRDISPEALAKIQSANQKIIGVVIKELDPEAHFVSYAPPAVVAFRKNAYLEFSLITMLPAGTGGSRYKIAALAFDEHISHLVHPMMAYFKGDLDFDGIAFSTTIHRQQKPQQESPQPPKPQPTNSPKNKPKEQPTDNQAPQQSDQPATGQGTEAVEFFFPIEALRCYEVYDCTGQQLIDQGSVLINGERITLDLQTAEAGAP